MRKKNKIINVPTTSKTSKTEQLVSAQTMFHFYTLWKCRKTEMNIDFKWFHAVVSEVFAYRQFVVVEAIGCK